MAISAKDRRESLKKFKPVYILESLDEKAGVIHQLIFYPALSLFKIVSSGEEGVPPIVISYNEFIKKKNLDKLNKRNYVDSIIKKMMKLWHGLSKKEKMNFCDNVPLNSLMLGCQYR